MNSDNKVAWNVAGGVIGALLACLAIFGVVQSQSQPQEQKYQKTISYNG